MDDKEHSYESLDGLLLAGSFKAADSAVENDFAALLVHGITADRNEGGFYRDLAEALALNGVGSLRFDLRAHGQSEGAMEDLTLLGGVSDVSASRRLLREIVGDDRRIVVIGASFGGGLSVLQAAREAPDALVLLNPNIDYAANWLGGTGTTARGAGLPAEVRENLRQQGWTPRGEFHLSRAMMNEVIHVRPADHMPSIPCPALTIHGTDDSMVSFDIARDNHRTAGPADFIAVEGADHGFVVPGDEEFVDPRTAAYRSRVIEDVTSWLSGLE